MSLPLSKIFLAHERGLNRADWFQSYNTFNFGQYQKEHKKPIGDIVVLNDDMLAPNGSLSMAVEDAYTIILIPVIGAAEYTDSTGAVHLAAAGQSVYVQAVTGLQYTIKNPFAEVAVNYIQLWVKNSVTTTYQSEIFTFDDVNSNLNKLVPASFNKNVGLYIGKFRGRGETVFTTAKPDSTLFAFVLAGAFEVEGCLLHDRDGLAMLQKSTAEMEALSNDALILLVEQPLRIPGF